METYGASHRTRRGARKTWATLEVRDSGVCQEELTMLPLLAIMLARLITRRTEDASAMSGKQRR